MSRLQTLAFVAAASFFGLASSGCRGAMGLTTVMLPHAGSTMLTMAVAAEISGTEEPRALMVVETPREFTPVDLTEQRVSPPQKFDPPVFSQGAARAALDVDLSDCRDSHGLASGYGFATVTFEPDGSASKIAIHDLMSADAQRCVADALDVTIPAFSGASVNVPTRFYVPPAKPTKQ